MLAEQVKSELFSEIINCMNLYDQTCYQASNDRPLVIKEKLSTLPLAYQVELFFPFLK